MPSAAPRASASESAIDLERSEQVLGFPSLPLAASAGGYALVPSRAALAQAFHGGLAAETFVFYGAWLEELGPKQSRVRWLTEQRGRMPNALILPLRPGESAARGEIVLTSWASGSGLERAIVVSEGASKSPRVRYLDLPLDHPSGWGEREDTLPANTFHVLRTPGEVGSTLACGSDDDRERVIVLSVSGERRLVLGFAGKIRALAASECRALPLAPAAKVGARVAVPVVGHFVPAVVQRVDAGAGRVVVKYDFGGEEREAQVGFGNVLEP